MADILFATLLIHRQTKIEVFTKELGYGTKELQSPNLQQGSN